MCREAEEKGRVKKLYIEGRKDVKNILRGLERYLSG